MLSMVAAVVLAVALPFVVFDVARRPTIRRLALRNVVRRPGEAAIVVGGSLLATALITASFIIGDSFGSSIRGVAADWLGSTDELVVVPDPAMLDETTERLAALSPDLVDGVLAVSMFEVAVRVTPLEVAGTTGSASGGDAAPAPIDTGLVSADVRLVELDPAQAVAFANDPEAVSTLDTTNAGSRQADRGPASVVMSQDLADEIGAAPGGSIDILIANTPTTLVVAAVDATTGFAAFGDLIVSNGTVSDHLDDAAAVGSSAVLVSNTGDVFSGADLTEQTTTAIRSTLGPQALIEPLKLDLLDNAEDEAAEMRELFGTVGGFSVAAGILLMVNLFMMLAGERRSEMGMLRATGLRRGHLVRAYALEGAVYGVLAAAAGVLVGIGVAAAVMKLAGGLIETSVPISIDVQTSSLLSGALIGLMVSQVTVLLTSWRVTRLNIVRAIRELPEPPSTRRSQRQMVLGAIGIVAGALAYLALGTNPIVAMTAPVLFLVSLIPFIERLLPRRAAIVVTCGPALIWVAAVFGLLPEVMDDPDIFLFLLQGVLLVGLATTILSVLDRFWLSGVARIGGGGIARRLGLAEPLARPVRSALLVAMYALVIFTVTFIAVLDSVFQAQAPDFAIQAGGAYDLYVDVNATSGINADDLGQRDDVVSATALSRGVVLGRLGDDDDRTNLPHWAIAGVDKTFLAAAPPALTGRLNRFNSDTEAWQALTSSGEALAIVDGDTGLNPGETYQFRASTGEFTTFTVAGTTAQMWLVNTSALVNEGSAESLFGDGRPPTRFFLDLADGADPDTVATELNTTEAEAGLEARTFLDAAKSATDEQQGFLILLQAYLGAGLLIGIAGLGVVLVRAVHERRRQFGVMRALGIAAPVIRRAFLVEALFVTLQGVALGVSLGLLSSWQVLTRSSAFEDNLGFRVPVTVLVLLAAGCALASLALATIPAVRASRTSPAAALRIT